MMTRDEETSWSQANTNIQYETDVFCRSWDHLLGPIWEEPARLSPAPTFWSANEVPLYFLKEEAEPFEYFSSGSFEVNVGLYIEYAAGLSRQFSSGQPPEYFTGPSGEYFVRLSQKQSAGWFGNEPAWSTQNHNAGILRECKPEAFRIFFAGPSQQFSTGLPRVFSTRLSHNQAGPSRVNRGQKEERYEGWSLDHFYPFVINSDNRGIPKVMPEVNLDNRWDSRKWNYHRPISVGRKVVRTAQGSAYVQLGETKILVLFNGYIKTDRETVKRNGYLNTNVKLGNKMNILVSDDTFLLETHTLERCLTQAIEPVIIRGSEDDVQLDLAVLVIEYNGCLVSTGIIGATVALLDGNIPMTDLVSASTAVILPSGYVLLDPTCLEEQSVMARDNPVMPRVQGIADVTYAPALDQYSFVFRHRPLLTPLAETFEATKINYESMHSLLPMLKEDAAITYTLLRKLLFDRLDLTTSHGDPLKTMSSTFSSCY